MMVVRVVSVEKAEEMVDATVQDLTLLKEEKSDLKSADLKAAGKAP